MQNLSVNFGSLSNVKDLGHGFQWYNEPQECHITEAGLHVTQKPESDFWRRTYQNPPADRNSGHALLHIIPITVQSCAIELLFSVNPVHQYDHAGLIIFVDDKHWLKAGYEIVDDTHLMSCVVTNDQSDWNCLNWVSSKDITVKVSVYRYELFVECKVEYKDGDEWKFLRETPLFLSVRNADVFFGLMCCGPQQKTANGMEAVFHNLTCTVTN